jgi:hypothetical protein
MAEAKTHQQRQIDDVFAGDEKPNDHSLAAKSWHRALSAEKPKTMAPDEWQAYYEATGQSPESASTQPSMLAKLLYTLKKRLGLSSASTNKTNKNCARLDMEDADF